MTLLGILVWLAIVGLAGWYATGWLLREGYDDGYWDGSHGMAHMFDEEDPS